MGIVESDTFYRAFDGKIDMETGTINIKGPKSLFELANLRNIQSVIFAKSHYAISCTQQLFKFTDSSIVSLVST